MNKREQTLHKTKFLLAGGAFVRIHWPIVSKRSIAGVRVTNDDGFLLLVDAATHGSEKVFFVGAYGLECKTAQTALVCTKIKPSSDVS